MTEANYKPSDHIYWAAETPDAIADAVRHQWHVYQERLKDDGRLDVWRTADRCYHGRNPDGGYANAHAVTFGGTQGEVAQLHVGHFRQIIGSQLTIATEARPAIECTATSNDPEAISDTIVARQVLEYDLDEGGLEAALHQTHELALVYSEGYIVQRWDFHAGDLLGTRMLSPEVVDASHEGIPGTEVEGGREAAEMQGVEVPVREGAVRVSVRMPIDVARDLERDGSDEEAPWYIVRERAHRWELAARYPDDAEKREAILSAPAACSDRDSMWAAKVSGADSDYVHVLTLYHLPTDALPQGRIVEVVDDVAISDDAYPFDHMVVHPDVPSLETGKVTGYGDSWDMLAPSQALDSVESGMLSVADAGSLVKYTAPRGQKVDARMLDQGMTLIEYDDNGLPGMKPPGLMERPEVRPSDRELSNHYRQTLEMLSGVNATIRGTAESEIKSGADRALIATMAVRANSKHQRSLAKLMRSVLNGRVKLYKAFCGEERLVEIAGRDKSGHVASFSASTLESVRRVRVDIGPPELRMTEGKMALADKMLEVYGPEVISPDMYLALRTTGRLDDIDNAVAEHRVNARRENDMFREGKGAMVQAIITDHHKCHIREHVRDLNDPAIRFDPARLEQILALTQHITAHAMVWGQTPPEVLASTGQDPAPSSLMGGPPPGMPPGAPPANDNGQPPMPMPANDNGMPPAEMGGPGGPSLPSMPMVAGTNERFQAPPGVAQ